MKRVIALGFFDGVHVGHGALLRTAKNRAEERGCIAAALTFDPHPNELIFGEKTPLINTLQERRELMTGLYGMAEMLVLPFERDFMEMDWQDFVKNVLMERFEAVHVVCGFDYTFGYRGLGNARKLQALCKELGIGCLHLRQGTGRS
jgi:riboflavin kinase/FMN adenylyltransferase